MGLDMYLKAKRFVGEYSEPELSEKVNAMDIPGRGNMKVNGITCEAMYWRKANAIHKWFVDNLQEGIDECQETYVSRANLEDLINTCKAVLEDNSKAPTLLPTGAGFFFGPTEYDEWYFKDLQDTVDRLTAVLSTTDDYWDFYYQSSW